MDLPSSIFVDCSALTTVTLASTMDEFALKAFNHSNALKTIVWRNKLTVYAPSGFDAALSGTDPGLIFINYGYDVNVLAGLTVDVDGYGALTLAYIAQAGLFIPYTYSATEQTSGRYWHYVNSVPTTWVLEVVGSGTTVTGCIGNGGVLIIPNGATTIADEAFYGRTYITGVVIPNSVTNIGDSSFADCTGITTVQMGSGVTSIGDYAFSGCSSLATINLPEGLLSIGEQAFTETALTSVTIPASVTTLGNCAFNNISTLVSVEFAEGNTMDLPSSIFVDCSALTTVTLASTMDEFALKAFNHSNALTTIIWRDNFIVYAPAGFDAALQKTTVGAVFILDGVNPAVAASLLVDIDGYAQPLSLYDIVSYGAFVPFTYSAETPTSAGNYWHYVNNIPTIW